MARASSTSRPTAVPSWSALGRTLLLAAVCAASAGCVGGRAAPGPSGARARQAGPPAAPTTDPVGGDGQWTTYGGSAARTSADTTEAPLTHEPSPAWTSPGLDGSIYGQPLVVDGTVLVATEADTVYALAASSGAVLWSLHLGQPVDARALPCGDISPTVGVTSTMVADPVTATLYVSAALASGGAVTHQLVAIDLATHTVRFQRVIDQPGWDPAAQLQRAGLALDGNVVLVGFGGNYGDCGRYAGWVVGVPTSGAGALLSYRVPAGGQGAVWAPPGPAVDASGAVYVATGNGSAGPGSGLDHGDAVIGLSPQLREQQYFAPADWAEDNADDADLGSTSPVLLGDGRLFQVGKQAVGYLLRASALGGVGGAARSVPLCNARGATAYAVSRLYVVCPDSGRLLEVGVGPGDGLGRGWTWQSPSGGVSSPTVARGAVWVVDPAASVLYGIDPASGATRWSLPLRTGAPPHFAAPSAGDGLIVVAGSRAVEAFH